MTCSYCATELPQGAMFCGECGRAVSPKSASNSATAPVARLTEPEKLVEPVVEPVVESVAVSAAESAAAAAAAAEFDPDPDPAPDPAPSPVAGLEHHAVAQRCAQCGAVVEESDIFCGECGFVRQSGAPVTSRPRDTVALDPFPWGSPPVAEASVLDEDLDETRIVDRSIRGDRFVLQFSTGDSVSVSGTGLIGRNPFPEPGEFFDVVVTISDPGKSVSKTHLEFGQEGGAFWISDRYSGNGTIVREPGSEPRRCDAGKRYRVVRGTRVDIGEQFFVVS